MVYYQSLFLLSLFKRENKGSNIKYQKQGWYSILPLSFGFLLIVVSSPASKYMFTSSQRADCFFMGLWMMLMNSFIDSHCRQMPRVFQDAKLRKLCSLKSSQLGRFISMNSPTVVRNDLNISKIQKEEDS